MNKNIFTYYFIFIIGVSALFGQMVPYEEPSLIQSQYNRLVPIRSFELENTNQPLNINIISNGVVSQINSNTHLFYKLSLVEDNIYDLSFDYKNIPMGTKLFIIEGDRFLGPILLSGTSDLIQRFSDQKIIEIVNKIAPEHLELNIKNYKKIVGKIKNAGSICLGK